jgi:hypothetical protein
MVDIDGSWSEPRAFRSAGVGVERGGSMTGSTVPLDVAEHIAIDPMLK